MSLKIFARTLIQNSVISRSYYTNRVNKTTLYSKISPLGNPKTSVVPELESWVKNGNKVRFAELQRIIHDLRKRKRFTQALEVSEWMNKKGIYVFTPSEHAVQLDLIGHVRGFLSAESYFNNLKDQDKTDKTYGALLNCYVRQRQTDKSITHMHKCMKAALSLHAGNKGLKPNLKVILSILNWLADEGSIEDVEDFVASLRTAIPVNRQMYHALIKSSLRCGREVDGLLEQMEADEIDEDEETKKILSVRQK
ncbi:pentatricopeptide repeat-containing protein At4g21705, mitochondrial [Carica papaya]|uniref:pentatricopeptide repeat-containing protein At4g21705, mitochondrial n=1 Tax=Carica papaya TaxID=3649 RepID=UPI000B8D010C|nr:pentatricopeptide repeat-containing protein At4g21705, mitochondrial [Carica papaya]